MKEMTIILLIFLLFLSGCSLNEKETDSNKPGIREYKVVNVRDVDVSMGKFGVSKYTVYTLRNEKDLSDTIMIKIERAQRDKDLKTGDIIKLDINKIGKNNSAYEYYEKGEI